MKAITHVVIDERDGIACARIEDRIDGSRVVMDEVLFPMKWAANKSAAHEIAMRIYREKRASREAGRRYGAEDARREGAELAAHAIGLARLILTGPDLGRNPDDEVPF